MNQPPPRLIVTVDTEEEGLFGEQFSAHGLSVKNLQFLGRFQSLCESWKVSPVYLIDTPVVENDAAAGQLREWVQGGTCEVGAHLHPWCAPPFGEETSTRNSFHCNLPAELEREKLQRLTEAIESRIVRPVSYRAGRYGQSARGLAVLEELGYELDSSVIPYMNYADQGGPDFRRTPDVPYFPSRTDITRTGDSPILEIPVTTGFSHSSFESCQAWYEWAHRSPFNKLRAVGILDRLNLVRKIKLSPEQADRIRLKQLIDACLSRKLPVLVVLLHSSSLMEGGSPYAKDRSGLEELYSRMRFILEYCCGERNMEPRTLSEFGREWRESPRVMV